MPADVVCGKLYPAEAGEQAGERELDLRARECGADAEVRADAELKVPVRRAADVEAVRFWELPGIPTRGPDGEAEGLTCSDLGSVPREANAEADALASTPLGPLRPKPTPSIDDFRSNSAVMMSFVFGASCEKTAGPQPSRNRLYPYPPAFRSLLASNRTVIRP